MKKLPSPLTIAWCKKNKALIQEMNAKFDKKKSPEHWTRPGEPNYYKTKLAAHKLRAEKLNRLPRWADEQEIEKVFRDAPDGVEIDHVVPMQGALVSGLHVANNLQYLTTKENASKHNNFKPRRSIIYRASISLF
jgi:hypothetical protein